MIQLRTKLKIIDHTGVLRIRCIKVYRNKWKNIGKIGDIILGVVEHYTLNMGLMLDEKKRLNFLSGTKHKILIIRMRYRFKRTNGVYLNFGENAGVIINEKKVPISKRIKGPVIIELGINYPGILSLCEEIL